MEIVGPNRIRLQPEERIYELIQLIKEDDQICARFLEGPLWMESKTTYRGKLVHRNYHLVNHHLYVIHTTTYGLEKSTYLKVSGRGNIHETTYEDACVVVRGRSGYIEDVDLANIGPNTEPSIPYEVNQDW